MSLQVTEEHTAEVPIECQEKEKCPCDNCDEECGSDCDCDCDDGDSYYTESSSEEDDKHCFLHGRWIYDGSNSIDEMIEALQRDIDLLKELKQDGWVLQKEVVDDRAYLVKVDDE